MTTPLVATIADAPNGQKNVLDGTEKTPIGGGQFVTTQAIVDLNPNNGRRFAVVTSNYATVPIAPAADAFLLIDTELVDDNNLVTLAGNIITAVEDGWYRITATVDVGSFAGVTPGKTFVIALITSGGSDSIFASHEASVGANFADYSAVATMYLAAAGAANMLEINLRNYTDVAVDAYLVSCTLEKLS